MTKETDADRELCPACGADTKGEKVCPECKLSLESGTDLIPDIRKESGDLISLFRISDAVEAQMIKTRLEDEGIPCLVSEGGMTSVFGVLTSGAYSTMVRIMVPESYAAQALKVLASHKSWGDDEPKAISEYARRSEMISHTGVSSANLKAGISPAIQF